jgi:uncharacterized protein (TIGR02391 family)
MELAGLIQASVDALGLGAMQGPAVTVSGGILALYDAVVRSVPLRAATRRLFENGHYARAVEEAFKLLNNEVKRKTGSTRDGADLMREAFSANSPLLKLNDLRSQSQQDEQRGYMELFAGSMIGIRNPRAHEHKLDDEPEAALELLAWANHLIERVEASKRTRRPRKPKP